MQRNGEAAVLWGEDYEQLSGFHETRTGRLAKLLARAEAQVCFLSLLLAVLDGEDVIGPEHHRAALALWSYAEASVRWIFGSEGTGNKDADKILAALKARPEGMERAVISAEIFQRNAKAERIASALMLLEGLGLARREICTTKGRAAEAWASIC